MNVKEGVIYDRPGVIRDLDKNVYACERYMAKGGFAKVYLVRQNDNKWYCGKYLSKEAGKKTKLNMYREIEIHKGLKHANVIRLCRCVEDRMFYCLVLEYCDNKSMSELIKRRKGLTEPEIRYYGRQILSGMKYLHCNNVIHRDIKPQNILINCRMILKIADFGLATKVRWRYCKIKKTMIYGTPNYISPEMVNPKIPEYDYKVDIWAIGVLLYDMVVGRPPFLGAKIEDVQQNILNCKYEIPPTVSKPLAGLIRNILILSPPKRLDYESICKDGFFITGHTPKLLPKSALVEAPRFECSKRPSKHTSLTAMIIRSDNWSSPIRAHASLKQSLSIKRKASNLIDSSLKELYCTRSCARYMLRRLKSEYMDITLEDKILYRWNESELETPCLEPIVWVKELVECKNGYCIGAYALNNNILGAVYQNKTIITILPGNHLQYCTPISNCKYIWKATDCPPLLRKKADGLKAIFHDSNRVDFPAEGDCISVMPYLLYYETSSESMILVLSTGLFQMNDKPNRCKAFLCPKLRAFTYVDKEHRSTTFGLNALKKFGHPVEVHDTLTFIFHNLNRLLNSDVCFICNKIVARKKAL